MGRWTVIVQALQSLGPFRSSGGLFIRYPPGNVGGPITFDKPIIAFGQDLSVEPVVGEGVDRLDIFPKRKGCRSVAVLRAGNPSVRVGVSSSGIHQATYAGQSPLTNHSSRLVKTSAWNPL